MKISDLWRYGIEAAARYGIEDCVVCALVLAEERQSGEQSHEWRQEAWGLTYGELTPWLPRPVAAGWIVQAALCELNGGASWYTAACLEAARALEEGRFVDARAAALVTTVADAPSALGSGAQRLMEAQRLAA